MVVYKFGGASVKDIGGIRNLADIVGRAGDKLVVVISAFGKTTNALEEVARKALDGDPSVSGLIDRLWDFHNSIIGELLPDNKSAHDFLADSFTLLRDFVSDPGCSDYDFIYDQVVSNGEIWSTMIIEEYLRITGIRSCWMDIRKILITDNRYRDANILWDESARKISNAVKLSDADVCVVQGFIGGTVEGHSTTLGREGSDYTAGVIANILDATRVEIWKDVPGILNADPGWMTDTHKLDFISYKDAVEMTFSGAKVIHPKTIKPLHNKGIPLFVRSFISPYEPGTEISSNESDKHSLPVFVRKENQVLISLMPSDFSFVMGEKLGKVFHIFYQYGIQTNLVQASAVSIAVCVDNDPLRISKLNDVLKEEFKILYNESVEMVSLRYYTEEAIKRVTSGRTILLEQRTRRSIRFVLK